MVIREGLGLKQKAEGRGFRQNGRAPGCSEIRPGKALKLAEEAQADQEARRT